MQLNIAVEQLKLSLLATPTRIKLELISFLNLLHPVFYCHFSVSLSEANLMCDASNDCPNLLNSYSYITVAGCPQLAPHWPCRGC